MEGDLDTLVIYKNKYWSFQKCLNTKLIRFSELLWLFKNIEAQGLLMRPYPIQPVGIWLTQRRTQYKTVAGGPKTESFCWAYVMFWCWSSVLLIGPTKRNIKLKGGFGTGPPRPTPPLFNFFSQGLLLYILPVEHANTVYLLKWTCNIYNIYFTYSLFSHRLCHPQYEHLYDNIV